MLGVCQCHLYYDERQSGILAVSLGRAAVILRDLQEMQGDVVWFDGNRFTQRQVELFPQAGLLFSGS